MSQFARNNPDLPPMHSIFPDKPRNYGKATVIPNVFCNVESPSRPLRKRESTQFFPAEIVCPITD